jgi:uncharacterized membrane protein
MILKHFCGAGLALISVLSAGSSAWADFRVCNRSPVKAAVAFGWNDPQDGWSSRGWWNLAPGGCESFVQGAVKSRVYYVYAMGGNGKNWGPRDSNQTGGAFCIDPKLKYVTRNRDYNSGTNLINCKASGLVGIQFDRVDTGEYADFTYNLMIGDGGSPQPQPEPVHTFTPPPPAPGPGGGGTACQRYPNLC